MSETNVPEEGTPTEDNRIHEDAHEAFVEGEEQDEDGLGTE